MNLPRQRVSRAPLALAAVGLAVTVALGAEPSGPDRDDDAVVASGSLAWVSDDALDMIGGLRFDAPLRLTPRFSLFLAADTETTIRQSLGDFTFDVRELLYTVDAGVRLRRARGPHVVFLAGQHGRERVDADGRAFVRYVGAGLTSRASSGLGPTWRLFAGPVLEHRALSADVRARGELHMAFPGRVGRAGFGFDAEVDVLVDGDDADADVRVGPRFLWELTDRHRISLFVHYLRGRNPLGPGLDGVLAGFAVIENPGNPPAGGGDAPDVGGLAAAGAGEGRGAGRVLLGFDLPRLPPGGWIAADFDANVLSGDDTDELYYLYRVGYERPLGGRIAGAWFYHRSNHRLASAGDEVTSRNVLELGVETRRFDGPFARAARGRWGRVDWRGRAGVLLTSSFGEDRRYNVLASVRWVSPWSAGGAIPFVSAEIEEGDAGRRRYAAGVAASRGFVVLVEHLRDEQFFGADRSATLLMGERRF